MVKSNYHTHSAFCDGKEHPEVYVQTALAKCFTHLGFSSHAPLGYPNDWAMPEESIVPYCSCIRELQKQYQDTLCIALGMEIDLLKMHSGPRSKQWTDLRLDYCIGSVHSLYAANLGQWLAVDSVSREMDTLLAQEFSNDIQSLVKSYYNILAALIQEHSPDILGHLDLIRKNNTANRYFNTSDPWYRHAVLEAVELLQGKETIVEINTKGKRSGYTDSFYPETWILRELFNRNIRVTVNSDAHHPDHLDSGFEEAYALLDAIGFKETYYWEKGKWMPAVIPE